MVNSLLMQLSSHVHCITPVPHKISTGAQNIHTSGLLFGLYGTTLWITIINQDSRQNTCTIRLVSWIFTPVEFCTVWMVISLLMQLSSDVHCIAYAPYYISTRIQDIYTSGFLCGLYGATLWIRPTILSQDSRQETMRLVSWIFT